MAPRFFLLSLIFSFVSEAFSQTGSYYLAHYTPPDERVDFRSRDIVQDGHGEIYFASKGGVLEFDGMKWRIIPMQAAVYTLQTYKDDVMMGGLLGAGRLKNNNEGDKNFDPFSDVPDVFASVVSQDKIYFCSPDKIIIYSLEQRLLEELIDKPTSESEFQGLFKLGKEVIVKVSNQLFRISNGSLVRLESGITDILFTSISEKGNTLVGTANNRIYLYENNSFREIKIRETGLLTKNILVKGVWVSDQVVALGTLRGGVLFINVQTGEIEGIVDYSSGLPDNEVFALMTDRNKGVWVAHEYGFTRIDSGIPFRMYHHYPGLQGNLLCVKEFENKIYVGTTLGLFQLNKSSDEVNSEDLNSNTYEFHSVKPVGGKITQLMEVDGMLVAGGSNGVFKIQQGNGEKILGDPVHHLFYSSIFSQILISTTDSQIKSFELVNNKFHETHLFDTLQRSVNHIFEDQLENLWICGNTFVSKIETIEGKIADVKEFSLQNPTQDETLGFSYGNDVYVISSGQFKRYNGNVFEKYDSISGGHRYFSSGGDFWFNDGKRWRTVNQKLQRMKLEWLGIFSNLRFLTPDEQGKGLWVVTDKNELYKFLNEQASSKEALYPIFLSEVKGGEVNRGKYVLINQTDGSYTFEFVQPDFLGVNTTQYRYMVKGLTNKWSAWSASNNVINFSFLPAGSYQLAVQSKDLLGVESEIEQISFKVVPPYWKRWWFYALEFLVFSILVLMSVRLSRADARYRILSQVLSILTVVMLIQFIETVIAALIGSQNSPVMEFFIQVSVALLVLPVEILVRIYLGKASKSGFKVQHVWDKEE